MKEAKKILFFLIGLTILYKFVRNMDSIKGTFGDLIKKFEGLKLRAYKDSAGIWTIGYGLITYPNGTKVKAGDTITKEQAESYFQETLQKFAQGVENAIKQPVTNNQFAALVSFAYNVGINAFKESTLLKLVNENPNNPAIEAQFMRWINAGGKPVQGLVNRRRQEANLYFS
jgi:lysozyme